MKRSDLLVAAALTLFLLPFFLFPAVFQAYQDMNLRHAYLMSFVKFALLATLGESIGLRIRTGVYNRHGFGLIPRALVWGGLGISIKMAFVIFGEGTPAMLKSVGIEIPGGNPADILRQPGLSWMKVVTALGVSTFLNLFFAPVFMGLHRITDTHILRTGGTLAGFFSPFPMGQYFREVNWYEFWDFVLKKTIPFFWIPAQAVNFLLPEGYRILVAALYSIVLGVLLSLAAMMQGKK